MDNKKIFKNIKVNNSDAEKKINKEELIKKSKLKIEEKNKVIEEKNKVIEEKNKIIENLKNQKIKFSQLKEDYKKQQLLLKKNKEDYKNQKINFSQDKEDYKKQQLLLKKNKEDYKKQQLLLKKNKEDYKNQKIKFSQDKEDFQNQKIKFKNSNSELLQRSELRIEEKNKVIEDLKNKIKLEIEENIKFNEDLKDRNIYLLNQNKAIFKYFLNSRINLIDILNIDIANSFYNFGKTDRPNIDQKEIDEILSKNFVSVIDKIPNIEIPGYNSVNDYLSYAPYWWPNQVTKNGLPFVWKDGLRRKECILFGVESYTNDRSSLQLLFDRLTKLSLAYKSSKDPKVLKYIWSQIFHWFIDENSRMNPNLEFAQTKRGIIESNSHGIIDFKDIYYLLGAIKLIEKDIKEKYTSIYEKFTYWLVEYKEWLMNSESARKASFSKNNHATCFFLQRVAIEEFLKNKNELFNTYILTNLLILNSIDKEGKQPEELKRTLSKHYCTFNLQQFLNLNYIFINSIKQSFFDNKDENNKLILAIKWLYQERSNWQYEQIGEFNEDKIDALLHIAKDQSSLINELIPNDSIKSIESLPDNFEPEAGIPLYWKNILLKKMT